MVDPETLALINAAERAAGSFTKAFCTEIKALNNPPEEVLKVIVTFADFVEGESGLNTFQTAKRKMFDYVKREVGLKERVTP